jgi:O-acetylserine/cysteine efflux transporter
MSPRDILLALLVAALWGINFVFIKLSVEALSPLLASALRFTLAVFPAIFFIKPPKTDWRIVVAFGLFFGVGLYAFLNIALAVGMPAGLASLVLQAQVLFTILLAYILFKENPTRAQMIGGAIALCGMGIIGFDRLESAGFLPYILTIGGALVWGVANILTKKAGQVDALSFTVWGCLVAPIPLFILSFIFEGPEVMRAGFANLDWTVWGYLAFQAYPTTVLGLAIWSSLLRRYSAASVTPFALLVPITGFISGWLILGERLNMFEVWGSVFVIVGVGVTIIRRRVTAKEQPKSAL